MLFRAKMVGVFITDLILMAIRQTVETYSQTAEKVCIYKAFLKERNMNLWKSTLSKMASNTSFVANNTTRFSAQRILPSITSANTDCFTATNMYICPTIILRYIFPLNCVVSMLCEGKVI